MLSDQPLGQPQVDYLFDVSRVIVPIPWRDAMICIRCCPANPALAHLLAQVPAGVERGFALAH